MPNPPDMGDGAFRAAFEVYATAKRRGGVGESSITQYRFRLRAWVRWLAAERGVAWQDAGPDDLDGFLGRKCQPKMLHAGASLAPRTKSEYAYLVRDWHRILYAKHVLPDDAMADYPPLPEPGPAGEPLELGDVDRLFRHLHDHPDRRLEPMAGLCYYNALRSGETAALTTSDLVLRGEKTSKIAVLGKGRLERVWLPLHSQLVPTFGAYTYWLAGQAGTTLRGLPAGTPLFQSRTCPGQPLGPSRPARLLAQAMREVPVDGRPHDLRRTAAHQVGVRSGHNAAEVRYVLRHRGWSALDAYWRIDVDEGRAVFEEIPKPSNGERKGG